MLDESLIDYFAGLANRLKLNLLLIGLDQHKMIVFIVTHGVEWAFQVDIATARLSAGTGDEVLNTILRLCALIDMVVRGEDDFDSVANEERFQLFA